MSLSFARLFTLATFLTVVTALPTFHTRRNVINRRGFHLFNKVFDGAEGHDAAVEAPDYLTFKVVSNSTYNEADCLEFCLSTPGCAFANLYYEHNNYGLDWEVSEQSNLKCALFGDVHTAADKTNFGGQQSYPAPAPLTYITKSSGWSLKILATPVVPEGYELVYGPANGANNAPGYMGHTTLEVYDVGVCAQKCNERDPDAVGGACKFFNIWRGNVKGQAPTFTCSFYYEVADESTATNYGQGDLTVDYSRGYRRI